MALWKPGRVVHMVPLAALALALGTGAATAAGEQSEEQYRAALENCKRIAEPTKRDECVSNAQNKLQRGNKAEKAPAQKKAKGGKGKN